uniref:tRNA selenocysteine-associated protein 1 n=1 Tax=Strigamia maritima TaxID=126957 RepID=T1IX77_STRMM
MGDLEPYMDETFLRNAFNQMGENFRNVKIMKNKYTGAFMGYCFLEFENEETALRVLHKLNGRILPNSSPPKRFKLNHANYGKDHAYNREFSLFVGDLSLDVDDLALYKAFGSRYPSVRAAKVVLDASGRSKGFGFIRFADEYEQQQALIQMQGYTGLGSKPLRVSPATQKRPTTATTTATTPPTDYSRYYQQYEQYQNYYSAWQDYSQQYYNYAYNYNYYNYDYQQQQPQTQVGYDAIGGAGAAVVYDTSDITVEEHDTILDTNRENYEYMARSEDLYSAMEESRWIPHEYLKPCVDTK